MRKPAFLLDHLIWSECSLREKSGAVKVSFHKLGKGQVLTRGCGSHPIGNVDDQPAFCCTYLWWKSLYLYESNNWTHDLILSSKAFRQAVLKIKVLLSRFFLVGEGKWTCSKYYVSPASLMEIYTYGRERRELETGREEDEKSAVNNMSRENWLICCPSRSVPLRADDDPVLQHSWSLSGMCNYITMTQAGLCRCVCTLKSTPPHKRCTVWE